MYVLMITPNKFPEGDAGAIRDQYYAKIYQELGYMVFHIGMNQNSEKGIYHNINFFSIYQKNDSFMEKINNALNYNKRLEHAVKFIEKEFGKPEFVHIYDISPNGIQWIKKYCKNQLIPLVHDSVEWFSPCEFKIGRLAYPYIFKDICNRWLINSSMSVYAISTYLENFFAQKGIDNVLRVPVIMDPDDYIPTERENNSKIKLVYAGSPAKKDYLVECIQGFLMLDSTEKEKFQFNILGVNKEYIANCINREIPKEINVMGRVQRKEVVKQLAESDFSILLRPENERYTKAGFPTKSVEAMMNGCAMICNLTSDLGMYLVDGDNAVIVEQCSAEAVYKALHRVGKFPDEKIKLLKRNARKTAEENFNYRKYIPLIKQFIEDMK